MSFLTDEQKDLANEIAALLTERGETVCVAESTTGGLVSAALLWVGAASEPYADGRGAAHWVPRARGAPVGGRRVQVLRRWRRALHAWLAHGAGGCAGIDV